MLWLDLNLLKSNIRQKKEENTLKNPALLSSSVERTAFMKPTLIATLTKMHSYNSSANLH